MLRITNETAACAKWMDFNSLVRALVLWFAALSSCCRLVLHIALLTSFYCSFVALLGVLNAGIGMTVGGLLGLAMFRSGSGYRSASVAAGFGVALGSTFERVRKANQ